MESARMRSATRIVAAPDRAARYQALHRRRARSDIDDSAGALTRTEHTDSVTEHNTDTPGGRGKTHHGEYGRMVAWGGVRAAVYCAFFRPPPYISALLPLSLRSLSRLISHRRKLSYSGRPVEGAASRAARQLCGCFFSFFFFLSSFFAPCSRSRALPLALSNSPSYLPLPPLFRGQNYPVKNGHVNCPQPGLRTSDPPTPLKPVAFWTLHSSLIPLRSWRKLS